MKPRGGSGRSSPGFDFRSSSSIRRPNQFKGRIAAFEILIANPAVRNLIREGKIFQILSIMQTSKALGMQTMEASVQDLLAKNAVNREEVAFYLSSKIQR